MSLGGAIALAARVVLAIILLRAAISKLRAREASRSATATLLGERAGPPIATALPFVELGVAMSLIVRWGPLPGLLAALLILGFTVVVVRANVRHVPCSCFGAPSEAPPGGGAILRNGALLALAILATGSP